MNDLVGRSIFLCGDLDRKITHFIKRYLGPGKVCVDVGANLGLVSLKALREVGPTGRVLSFEPSPPVHSYLDQTAARNQDLPWELERVALGAETAELELHVPPGNAGAGSLVNPSIAEGSTRHVVPVKRLGDVLAARHIDRVDMLKIDVEGAELGVLQGLFVVETAPKPRAILYEDHRPLDSGCRDLLEAEGYRVDGIVPKTMLSVKLCKSNSSDFARCQDFVATLTS